MNINSWQGQWSDGKSAATHPVSVRIDQDQIEIKFIENASKMHIFWALDDLSSPNPITRRTDHVLLTASSHPGERLFVNEVSFAQAILSVAPKLSSMAHSWSLLKWPLGIAAAITLFFLATYFDLISPAKRLAFMMPDKARTTIGTNVIDLIRRDAKICSTPQGDKALEKMIARLTNNATNSANYNVRVADMKISNAFAAPGDQIIVSAKLIREADSADEVAGVIAHEMGHAIERHPETNIVRALGLISLMQLMTAGEAGAVGEIAFFMIQSGYSRGAETEADEIGARILKESDIDTRPLAKFFTRIIAKYEEKKRNAEKKAETGGKEDEKKPTEPTDSALEKSTTERKNDGSLLDFLSTHPPTQQRIEFFNASARETSPQILTELEWQALREICGKKQENNNSEGTSDAEE